MSIPDLDERFLQPEGWRWHEFNREERRLRFGTVSPKGNLPDAVVICLPGLSEFAEKYFEVARTCLDQNLSFWVIDWMGQGGSGRYLEDRQKRHGTSFQDDVDDLFHLYSEYVKHSSVHPDVGRIPLVMLAHSMGGNIGLQFIKQHPTIFHLAAFSAPLLGFSQIENHKLKKIAPLLIHASKQFSGQKYISDGGSWSDRPRVFEGPEALSSDPQRAKVHSAWFEANPDLQVGSPTNVWLYHALQACVRAGLQAETIKIPCLAAVAGEERLVSNKRIHDVFSRVSGAKILELPKARHEILMEKNEIRDEFFNEFYQLIQTHIINDPEALKPF